MKAILFDRFGGTEVLREADSEVPRPGPGQIRVRVEAAGLNALDGADAVFDLAGKGALEDSVTLRGGTERIVTITDFRAHRLGITFAGGLRKRSAARLADLAQDASTGEVVTTVTAYPLAEAVTAQQVSGAGHVRGKLVLTLG
ncbi:zinc-binding dehydrogenase [Streptomyces sp. NPDC057690]|uniref:zinc-binding dehydrogenase n=1 Tax=Streptomyces sp. NPDC057690 TaxID=3346214 RepID=UPI0036B24D24